MTTPPPGTQSEAAQDLIEVRLKRAAEVAPVRIVTDYAMSSTSTPIRSVMLEAAQELATLRAALAPPADGAGEVEAEAEDFLDYVRDTLDDMPPLGGCTFCGHDPYHRTEFGEPVGIVCCEPRSWLIQDNEEDEEIREAVSKLIGSRNQQHTALGTALKRYENLLRLLSEERARRVEVEETLNTVGAVIVQDAYDAGFMDSGEGWNGEYPGDAPTTEYYTDTRSKSIAGVWGKHARATHKDTQDE